MRKIAVIDAETDPFRKGRIPAPFIWGYYDGNEFRTFDSGDSLCEFLRENDSIVYAHNGGKFDYHFLLRYLAPFDDIKIINGRIAVMHIGQCELRDSYNIVPVPLSAYKKDEIDYAIMEKSERTRPDNANTIRAYLRSDCVYLFELISKFIESFGLKLTLAGASMAEWKRISAQPIPETDADFYAEISPYYYGGRVECFQSGIIEKNFAVYDINSAYPYAMTFEHPYSVEKERANGYLKDADFVRVLASSVGAFPFRGAGKGINASDSEGMEDENVLGLWFPHDGLWREFTITGHEYRMANDHGILYKSKVIESIRFAGRISFRDYVNHFYEMRNKAKAANDDANSLFAKLFMNSLYGKFAANPERYNNYCIVPKSDAADLAACTEAEWNEAGWKFGGELGPWILAQSELADAEKRYYNVATGASITGFVRAMLFDAIKSSKGVLYCDTDSIAVESLGLQNICGPKLGQWKHEGDFDKAGIGGKKLYIFRGIGKTPNKTASKGVRLTEAELWKVAKGETVKYEPEAPTFAIRKAPVFQSRNVRSTVK